MSYRIKSIIASCLIFLMAYGFLSLCNWDFNPATWNGASRFLLGLVAVMLIIDELDNK